MRRILVTGATGFVGGAVLHALYESGVSLVAHVRAPSGELPGDVKQAIIPNIDADSGWGDALLGADVVIHCAGRVHVMSEAYVDPLSEYRKVNVNGTLALARQAAAAGVKRFIFISSIKVNGEMTPEGAVFRHDDIPAPIDAYGISKAEAEVGLAALCEETGMELVIIRPPLVYGPGVKGNFSRLIDLTGQGIPLPLGAVNNKRSLVALDNLISLIVLCTTHPNATGQVFLVSDGEPVSTPSLIRALASAMGKRCWLIPVPGWMFRVGLSLVGKQAAANRLLGSLVVNIDHTRSTLGWRPVVSLQEGLLSTVEKVSR